MTSISKLLMLFDNVNRDYVARLQKGAKQHASSLGIVLETENGFGTDREAFEIVETVQPAGVILTAPLSDDRHLLTLLERQGVPYARISSMLDAGRGITISMDEYDAARSVTALLLEAGHRRIGIIRGPRSHLSSMRRYNGFTAALGAKGAKLDPKLVVEGDYSREGVAAQAETILQQNPTAIFASNDAMAAGLADAARKAGKSLPRDLSIVGFDDDPLAQKMHPPLTTVRQPLEEMGRAACQMLADCVAGKGPAKAHADVPFEIVERSSVAAFRELADSAVR